MHDTVTIHGNLGGEPVKNTTTAGASVVNFRVACSSGYWDRRTGSWVDTGTSWYDVAAFRQLADHAKASLHSGDPVIITGSLRLKEWESNGRRGMSAEITAESIGHDLRRGTSAFVRTPRAPMQALPTHGRGEQSSFTDESRPPSYAQSEEEQVEDGLPDVPVTDAERDGWDAAGLEARDVDSYSDESGDVALAAR
ncbi:single-stranded DNA-binding protein [Microbacterium sp.]|uniref:single-stranded DNA-binding protein n=1 Tax=Microbacterium sp. TaxID=51671 RepID=UPI0028121551|nr:single-stranded DNA-binding protein [Microbacterium sp.]